MAVSPPSDIVLDVARAVDSTELEAARTRLAAAAGPARADAAFSVASGAPAGGAVSGLPGRQAPGRQVPDRQTMVRFEAMVLRNFVEAMLPRDAAAVYGEGLAGDMWKSLLADNVATTIAERGGIGIADRVLADYYTRGEEKVPLSGVAQGGAEEARAARALREGAMKSELQLDIMRSLIGGPGARDHS